MREILSSHAGQAGCQTGKACWELYCLQHGILPDGQMLSEKRASEGDDSFNTFFGQTSARKYVPRAVMVDLKPTVVDQLRTQTYKHLFYPEELLVEKENATDGYVSSEEKKIVDLILDRFRNLTDQGTLLQDSVMFNLFGDGTASELASLLTEQEFGTFTSPQKYTAVIEPYNSILRNQMALEHSDCKFMIENSTVYDLCLKNWVAESLAYISVNRLVAQVVSCLSASLHIDGAPKLDLLNFQTNLVLKDTNCSINMKRIVHAKLKVRDELAKVQRSIGTLDRKLDSMYAKRALFHWYVSEEMEKEEFSEVVALQNNCE